MEEEDNAKDAAENEDDAKDNADVNLNSTI